MRVPVITCAAFLVASLVTLAPTHHAGAGLPAQPASPQPSTPATTEPGPLVGGQYGAQYLGPGFLFYLPPDWTIDLDDIPAGQGRRGERGTAHPGAGGDDGLGASIRFEPFPPGGEPGRAASLKEYEAHIRATVAAGVPVGVLPLLSDANGNCMRRAEGPEGIAILFTRPGADGGAASQRRYVVYALPRADGRLQTIVCSHLGPAARDHSSLFMRVGSDFATTWPDKGGVFRRDDLGVVLAYPPGWDQVMSVECGQGAMLPEQEQRRIFMPVARFGATDRAPEHPRFLPSPAIDLEIVQELKGSPDDLLRPYGAPPEAWRDFTFADGAVGRIAEIGWTMIIVRSDGRRVVKAQTWEMKPGDREGVLALLRGLQLVEPTPPEESADHPKLLHAQGVWITYPGDWRAVHACGPSHAQQLLAGGLAPIAGPRGPAPGREIVPELNFGVLRLDDLRAEHDRWRTVRPDPVKRALPQTTTRDEQPFTTDSGWTGWTWTTTTTIEAKKGRMTLRTTEYILPMPDGVTALHLAGGTTARDENQHAVDSMEQAWRKIAQSARTGQAAPPPRRDAAS